MKRFLTVILLLIATAAWGASGDQYVPALPAASNLTGADIVGSQGSVTKRFPESLFASRTALNNYSTAKAAKDTSQDAAIAGKATAAQGAKADSALQPTSPGISKDIRAYGAKCDVQVDPDGASTVLVSGRVQVTITRGAFASNDVGKAIVVLNASPAGGGANLVSTITSVLSSTTVVTVATAHTAVTGKRAVWGTDDSTAILAYITNAPQGTDGITPALEVKLNGACYLGSTVDYVRNNVTWVGPGTLYFDDILAVVPRSPQKAAALINEGSLGGYPVDFSSKRKGSRFDNVTFDGMQDRFVVGATAPVYSTAIAFKLKNDDSSYTNEDNEVVDCTFVNVKIGVDTPQSAPHLWVHGKNRFMSSDIPGSIAIRFDHGNDGVLEDAYISGYETGIIHNQNGIYVRNNHMTCGLEHDPNGITPISATPTAAGSGYQVGDLLTFPVAQGGTQPSLRVAAVNGSGGVTSLTEITHGSGYSSTSGIPTSGGHGTGCTINVLGYGTPNYVGGGNGAGTTVKYNVISQAGGFLQNNYFDCCEIANVKVTAALTPTGGFAWPVPVIIQNNRFLNKIWNAVPISFEPPTGPVSMVGVSIEGNYMSNTSFTTPATYYSPNINHSGDSNFVVQGNTYYNVTPDPFERTAPTLNGNAGTFLNGTGVFSAPSGSGDMLKSNYDPQGKNSDAFARGNHTGTQSADTIMDGTTNKAYTAAEKTKLAGLDTSGLAPKTTSITAGAGLTGGGDLSVNRTLAVKLTDSVALADSTTAASAAAVKAANDLAASKQAPLTAGVDYLQVNNPVITGVATLAGTKPTSDSASAFQFYAADGSTPVATVDSTGAQLLLSGVNSGFYTTNYSSGTTATFAAKQALGTATAPRRVLSGSKLGRLTFRGAYAVDDTTNATLEPSGRVNLYAYASEPHTSTAQGTYITIETTNTGSTTPTEKVRINPNGNVSIGTTADNGYKLEVTGTAKVSSDATVGSINKITLTPPATGSTFTLLDGKTLTINNTLTLSGTDGSTLNIGGGGTLGSAAFTASTAYLAAAAQAADSDKLDGQHGSYYSKANGQTHTQGTSTTLDLDANDGFQISAASGTVSLTVNNLANGKYFDIEITSTSGALTLNAPLFTGATFPNGNNSTAVAAGKKSHYVCKGTGSSAATCYTLTESK